jgi:hypothetical protein
MTAFATRCPRSESKCIPLLVIVGKGNIVHATRKPLSVSHSLQRLCLRIVFQPFAAQLSQSSGKMTDRNYDYTSSDCGLTSDSQIYSTRETSRSQAPDVRR